MIKYSVSVIVPVYGVEKYIDVNVFCGSIEEFEEYLVSYTYKN